MIQVEKYLFQLNFLIKNSVLLEAPIKRAGLSILYWIKFLNSLICFFPEYRNTNLVVQIYYNLIIENNLKLKKLVKKRYKYKIFFYKVKIDKAYRCNYKKRENHQMINTGSM